MPSISIPTALRQYAGGQASVNVEATHIGGALDKLTAQFPDLRKHLFDASGKLRNFVNVYVNDEDIRYLQKEDTAIKEKDELARYNRHLILPEVGLEGQRKLKAASVLLIGAGGLGSPLGLYLAAAGVGRL